MSIIPAGFTRLDNETDVVTLLGLPNALVQPYLFLLTRARLSRPGAHWGEIAAAIDRSQTQIHAALRALKDRGLAEESGGLWLAIRMKTTGNPQDTPKEVAPKPGGNPAACDMESPRPSPEHPVEPPRKPATDDGEKAVQDDRNADPKEGSEGTEGKKTEQTPLPPQGEVGMGEDVTPAQPQTPTPDARPAQPKDPEKVPRRRAPAAPAPVLPDDLAALPGLPEAWDRWLRYRAEARIKTPATTADEQFRKLRDLHAQGWDLPHIVAHAIEVGWKSFFPIRGEQPRQNLRLPPHDTAHADPDEKKDWLA